MPRRYSAPGTSVQLQHERRAALAAADRAPRRQLALLVVVVTAISVFVLVRLGGPVLADLVVDQIASTASGDASIDAGTDGSTSTLIAALFATAAALAMGRALLTRGPQPQPVPSRRRG